MYLRSSLALTYRYRHRRVRITATSFNRMSTQHAPKKGRLTNPLLKFFGGVTDDMRIAREEIFGPVISALPFDDLDEVVTRANDTPYGLAAGVFSTNLGTAHKLAHRLKAGSVWVNMYHAIDPAVPFGGVKMSGYGREGGTEHLEEHLDTKAIWINAD